MCPEGKDGDFCQLKKTIPGKLVTIWQDQIIILTFRLTVENKASLGQDFNIFLSPQMILATTFSISDYLLLLPSRSPHSKAPETFRARKAIPSSSISKNGEVHTLETSCMNGTSIHINNM